MREDFYCPNPAYHVARQRFVYKGPARTSLPGTFTPENCPGVPRGATWFGTSKSTVWCLNGQFRVGKIMFARWLSAKGVRG